MKFAAAASVSVVSLSIVTALASVCHGQASGNAAFSQSAVRARLDQKQQRLRTVLKDDQPPGASTFVEANVLMNVKADEYVAVFGIVQEGATANECSEKMEATVKAFSIQLMPLGIGGGDVFVDFVAQHKIYGFDIQAELARERLMGFELKKNVSVRFKDHNLLDKLVVAAAGAQIFDLIKVDYVVKDTAAIQDCLMEEAAKIVKQKAARYEKLLGLKLVGPAQIFAERTSVQYPSEMYDAYTAYESEPVRLPSQQRYTIQMARKSRTFFLNGLDGDGFDTVVNPVMLEPPVQFTLYLKVKHEAAAPAAK
jgi:uncharacterized protein YggE